MDSGPVIVEGFHRSFLRFEEISRHYLREIWLLEDLKYLTLKILVPIMPQRRNFREMPLFEVRDPSFHKLPARGIDSGKMVQHLVQRNANGNLPVVFHLRYSAGQIESTMSVMQMLSSTMPVSVTMPVS